MFSILAKFFIAILFSTHNMLTNYQKCLIPFIFYVAGQWPYISLSQGKGLKLTIAEEEGHEAQWS